MKKVHILPPDVISKIAAGEVIERPASVIKELMENALDAETKTIEIHLKEAGKALIHIKDTGVGIEREDIETIFLRHSTSKIAKADDLYNIHSLGFRGEALYSISSIADITLRSRTKNQDMGWEIHLRGGKNLDLRPLPMPTIGTEIEVKELFFNTPARRKFLKSNTTELNQILNIFISYTLLYPDCRFLLTHQEKTLLDLQPSALISRIAETLNLDKEHLTEVKQDFPEDEVTIRMILGDMNIVRSRRDLQFIFVNDRPVQNKNITFHINAVYRLILPPNNFSFFAVYLNLPAEDVDVNIHPTKREVKIKDEFRVASLLRNLCERALLSQGQTKQIKTMGTKLQKEFSVERALAGTKPLEAAFDEPSSMEIWEHSSPGPTQPNPTEQYAFPQTEEFSFTDKTLVTQKQSHLQKKLFRARYLGQFINKFLLFEVDTSLLVIDQHAAQERITFEHFIKQLQKGTVEVQHLLSPYLIKLSPQEIVNWEEAKERLDTIGFATNQWDPETIAVHTYPILLKEPEKSVRDLLAGGSVIRCDHETIARRACRCSIMAGDSLNPQEAEFVRDQLIKCRDPFTCPHGRPTVVEMTESFLDKQFLRT